MNERPGVIRVGNIEIVMMPPIVVEGDSMSLEEGIPSGLPQALIRALRGMFGEAPQNLDFGSAHFLYCAHCPVPEDIWEQQAEKIRSQPKESYVGKTHLRDFFNNILQRETTLDMNRFNLHAFPGPTRNALIHLFKHQANKPKGAIALPIPNWHFWAMNECEPELRANPIRFEYFEALNEDQLAQGFEKIARQGKVGSLVLVDPANPLMYHISESALKQIDATAQKYGIDIIVDDVLRGTRPMQDRNSIGSKLTRPFVVEGLSKRLGDEPAGVYSYILSPKDSNLPDLAIPQSSSYLAGDILTLFYEHASQHALNELRLRNAAFDEGLTCTAPMATVSRPFPSSLTSVVQVNNNGFDALKFAEHAHYQKQIDVIPFQAFCPNGYNLPKPLTDRFRITVGRTNLRDMHSAATKLGEAISEYRVD